MTELTSEQLCEVSGGGNRYITALRFVSARARFGGPVGFAIGIGIEAYLQFR